MLTRVVLAVRELRLLWRPTVDQPATSTLCAADRVRCLFRRCLGRPAGGVSEPHGPWPIRSSPLALRLDRKIDWDSERMQVRDCPKAVPFVKRSYRTGW